MYLMKKILSLLICFQILSLPVLAEYDFSDEAQAEFDRNKYQNINSQPMDFTKKRNRTEIKNNTPKDITTPTVINEEMQPNAFTPPSHQTLTGYIVEIPSGATFSVTFDSGISSGSLEKNDRLTVRLTNDLRYNGKLIAPAGSLVYGTATDAKNAGLAYGSGMIEIAFNEILTPEGTPITISTEKVYLKAQSERAKKMTRDVVVGALGSMLVGAALTALGGGSDDWGRNMLIFGSLGAAGGGLRGSMQRGEEVQIPDGTTIQVRLNQPLNANGY